MRVNKLDWPPKVRADFPLTVGARGYYKQIAGKLRWICGKKPPEEALKIYHRKAAALESGHRPMPEPKPSQPDTATMHYILNEWAKARRNDVADGGLKMRTWEQYRRTAKRINKVAGHYLCSDWNPEVTKELHRRLKTDWGEDFARRAIAHLRDCCRYAAERGWCRPVRLGESVVAELTARPAVEIEWRFYTPEEIGRILDASRKMIEAKSHRKVHVQQQQQLHAMILLALNGGFGAQELSDLPKIAIDLDGAMLTSVRKKTGKKHVTPLWPETVKALRPVLAQRPDDELLFRTRQGNPWCYNSVKMEGGKPKKTRANDNVADRFAELVRPIGLKIEGQGFYKLKHLALSTGDCAGDPHATFVLFGHQLPGAKKHYVRVTDERLRAVTDYMRAVLILNRPPEHPRSSAESRLAPDQHGNPGIPADSSPKSADGSKA